VIQLLIIAGMFVALTGVGIVATRRDGLSGRWARRRTRRRALMRVPETAIAAVKNGERVRLKGRAVARAPLGTSPLSQRPCIAYHIVIADIRSGELVLDQEGFDSFTLTDGTGEAMLHGPFQLELDPFDARELDGGYDARSESVPQTLSDLVKQSGYKVTTFGRQDALRYVETLLQPGDEIIAVGRATIEIDQAGRAPPRGLPVMCHLKGSDKPVVIADAEEL
jgi:hypothetical protein